MRINSSGLAPLGAGLFLFEGDCGYPRIRGQKEPGTPPLAVSVLRKGGAVDDQSDHRDPRVRVVRGIYGCRNRC